MAKMKIIKIQKEFEQQDAETIYELDFNKTNKYKITFTDGYYVVISDKVEHVENDDEVEAILYNSNDEKKSYNWANSRVDEVQYHVYNWFMELSLKNESNVYSLAFRRGRPVGGGFL